MEGAGNLACFPLLVGPEAQNFVVAEDVVRVGLLGVDVVQGWTGLAAVVMVGLENDYERRDREFSEAH